ncbi:hypothetical protein [Pseudoalteromonas sp. SG43-3]|uniref:hypothetical protein n=1 Tax=Pseudoalteromonas sp. SG43-3 TaxID=2760970 RepID=UPI0016020CF9|nr:hypothetical protein [Pseudoalteromonas sp. SG43-3]MBB1443025.1 hypothetical protein [Pseudoalteromonas sp. SG43-3]
MMSNDAIFFTQIASIVGFIVALFAIYKVLIQQKDAVIQLLKEQIQIKNECITDLKLATPDSLAKSLNERIVIFETEIKRLKLDEKNHKLEIEDKENIVNKVRELLLELAGKIEDESLVCPDCGAPLVTRHYQTEYREFDGVDRSIGDVECALYQCGYASEDQIERSPCRNKHNS